jgi:Tfp pilus assembly protein PilW
MIQGQGGSTLIELLVAMPIAVMLLGLVVQALGDAGKQQQDIESRTEALTNGQISLERMTREIRQSNWVYFRSSSVVDLEVPVRPNPTASSVPRLVRFDCSSEVCTRSEGAPVTYPPPSSPTFATEVRMIGDPSTDRNGLYGQITSHDIFRPTKIDTETGASNVEYFAPDFIFVRVQLAVRGREEPLVLEDGVSVRNQSSFKS